MLITDIPYSPLVSWSTETYNTDNATINLEWSKEIGVTYSVRVNPHPLEKNMTDENTSQLIVLYNTSYSVIVLAALCGKNMNMVVINITLNQLGELKLRSECTT